MIKLIKYELRGTFLTIIGICITIIIGSLLLMTRRNSWPSDLITGLSVLLIVGALIVIFISSLKIMSKYLYEDSGYLLFTLPQSGVSIIASRLITALIQISIVALVSIFMCYLTLSGKLSLSSFKDLTVSVILYCIISFIWNIVYFLTFIYFCMIIGKVALKGKKLGKIGSFIIFIILSVGISWLSFKIINIFPQTFMGGSSISTNIQASNSGFSISSNAISLNIASTILSIIVFAGAFITSSYLIDNKLDLS